MTDGMGERFAAALAAKDATGLQSLMADDIDFRALTPKRFWEETTPAAVVGNVMLGHWFEPTDVITAVESVETGNVEDRDSLTYRFHVSNPEGEFTVEQQAYYEVTDGRISYLRMLCSGYRPA